MYWQNDFVWFWNLKFNLLYMQKCCTLGLGIKKLTQSTWVYAWLKPFQTALSFRDCKLKIPLLIKKMKNCTWVIILKKKITHCGTAYWRILTRYITTMPFYSLQVIPRALETRLKIEDWVCFLLIMKKKCCDGVTYLPLILP